jgi:hypothetical protein
MRAGRIGRSCPLPDHIKNLLPLWPSLALNLDLDLERGPEVALIQNALPPPRFIELGQGRATPGLIERNLFEA